MTSTVIKLVQAIEADYGTVNCKEAASDPRLIYIHSMYKNEDQEKSNLTTNKNKIEKAQRLLDSANLPKYKIAELSGYNKDYFGTLCANGCLDDSKWYERRRNMHKYEYYCDDKLVAKGTINQISILMGKSPSTIRGCTLSVYRKYKHEHTYRLVKVK